MSGAHPVLADLCAAMGISRASITTPLTLQFDRSGTLQIDDDAQGYVVLLARHLPPHRHGVAAAALRAIHPDRGLPHRVKVAFRGDDTLVLLGRLTREAADLPAMDGLVRLLVRLADEAEAAA